MKRVAAEERTPASQTDAPWVLLMPPEMGWPFAVMSLSATKVARLDLLDLRPDYLPSGPEPALTAPSGTQGALLKKPPTVALPMMARRRSAAATAEAHFADRPAVLHHRPPDATPPRAAPFAVAVQKDLLVQPFFCQP